jgi:hypothetical protein
MGDLFQPWHMIVLFFAFSFWFVLFVVPYWFICKKAGFSPWLTLLNLIPLGNAVLTLFLAFAEWKVAPAPRPQPPVPQP